MMYSTVKMHTGVNSTSWKMESASVLQVRHFRGCFRLEYVSGCDGQNNIIMIAITLAVQQTLVERQVDAGPASHRPPLYLEI